ncbi:ATP:cob(I)alamin adenosyltransferase, partial [Paraburkholderia sp. BR14262]
AERAVVAVGASANSGPLLADTPRRYVNRLSDLLFVLARVLNRAAGGSDVLWRHDRGAGKRE